MPNHLKGRLALYLWVVCMGCMWGAVSSTLGAVVSVAGMDPAGYPAPKVGCLATDKCRSGIEPDHTWLPADNDC
jgi:hypothetical protein